MSTTKQPYMLLFHDIGSDAYKGMSPEQIQQYLERFYAWYDRLHAEGRLDHGKPLEPEGRVVSGIRGERVVDGPFVESKEAIGGYFLLMVESLDEATEIAKECPWLEIGMKVSVRPVAESCSVAKRVNFHRPAQLAAV